MERYLGANVQYSFNRELGLQLDDQSKDNQKLLGNLTGMNEVPSVRLVDMLERVPLVLKV